jgi:hypothetical protein
MKLFDKLKKKSENIKLESDNHMAIELDRDSVCMGDDCQPHKLNRTFDEIMTIFDFLLEISDYVPSMHNVVWVVVSLNSINKVIGYIVTDEEGKATVELNSSNVRLKDILENKVDIKVFCRYYHQSSFSWIDGNTKQPIEKYSECKTLLEKVKIDC